MLQALFSVTGTGTAVTYTVTGTFNLAQGSVAVGAGVLMLLH